MLPVWQAIENYLRRCKQAMVEFSFPQRPFFRVRSYVSRNGRKTAAQAEALQAFWPIFGLNIVDGPLAPKHTFGREAPLFLEIGFGSGQSLLALATACPQFDFIGVETYQPGIGAMLHGLMQAGLTNVRLYAADVVDVFAQCVQDDSLSGINCFFPDPWPKRRHHVRRLMQGPWAKTMAAKLRHQGTLHLATDCEDYAKQMLRIFSQVPDWANAVGPGQFAKRSPYRPIKTKFEKRAEREGRQVFELQWSVIK